MRVWMPIPRYDLMEFPLIWGVPIDAGQIASRMKTTPTVTTDYWHSTCFQKWGHGE